MRIRDDALRCVVFIGIEISEHSSKKIKWGGTGFFVSRKSDKFSGSFVYLVTAKHVLIDIGKNDFFIRVNTKDKKSSTLKVEAGLDWFRHETSDVALYPLVIPRSIFDSFDYSSLPVEMFVTDESIEKEGIGPGDDVFMTGLFAHHTGNEKNLPIVRMGHIAMLPDEPIPHKDFGVLEAYLIESHSLGGLSGSPVFVMKEVELGRWRIHLLGLISGHWEIDSEKVIDVEQFDAAKKGAKKGAVNVGIAIVIPAKIIREVIESPDLTRIREKMEKQYLELNSPKPDKHP